MNDEAPFRFNFDVGAEASKESEDCSRSPKRPREGEELVPAEVVEVEGSGWSGDGDNDEGYGIQEVGNSIRLWKVVKLLEQSTLVQGLDESTDLVPGRYEGGFKVWECSVDLCQYLMQLYNLGESDGKDGNGSKHGDLQGKSVLELGCGQGLPGILCLAHGASSVVFQDFNKEVLRSVTYPCVEKNARHHGKQTNGAATYISGDWSGCRDLLGKQCYDLVLAAETIYEPKSIPSLLDLLSSCVKPKTGVVLVAAKVYYFGVGGGVAPFEQAVKEQGLFDLDHVFRVDDGASNMREILMLKTKPRRDPGAPDL
ncbi:methyltransferase [Chloropicon primus]|uniref:protein-histidine N-methyltransferase n=1 Tax=Chloropicon primus TaxID=1764295 RepID=A0A5B8MRN1_9CHLO|nr:methyltransferase [Chloropicon primus]UPR02600.1 methyltransferase [Chloropicon primus]|eukprot:QDZ23388.1 methyltransferase [Chloropicon primus]